MERLAKGDRSAFDPVFAAVRPVVESFAARMMGPIDAKDIAQDTLLDVFRSAADFDPERDALSWVLGIAAYNVKTARKRIARRREDPAVSDRVAIDRSPEERAIDHDLRIALEEILGHLRPADADVILAVLERRARPTIDPRAFRKRAQRAVERLRRAWGARHGTE